MLVISPVKPVIDGSKKPRYSLNLSVESRSGSSVIKSIFRLTLGNSLVICCFI
ncbi:uncharacterized protein METZ01_LOCUS109324 [marine metagenome]|uniref:Uncharacterized protein n=1 Tax=marine metagenome TaxID=408172 RepID=A0A381WVK1_9ZZZZ